MSKCQAKDCWRDARSAAYCSYECAVDEKHRQQIEKIQNRVVELEAENKRLVVELVTNKMQDLIDFAESEPELWEEFKITNEYLVNKLLSILEGRHGNV